MGYFMTYRHYTIAAILVLIILLMMTAHNHMETDTDRTHKALLNDLQAGKAEFTRYLDDLVSNRTLEDTRKLPATKSPLEKIIKPSAAIDLYNDENTKDNAGENVNVDRHLTRKSALPPLDGYWAKILHFIPKEDSQNCLNLFTTESSRAISITPEWRTVRETAQMAHFKEKFAPQNVKLTLTYQELARQHFVHTVCEIGFNVGQSAIAWLTAKPHLKLYSFDIGGHLQEKMGGILKKMFPDHFNLTIGDSTKTVPPWVEKGIKCDIVSIDGGHTYPIVHADILNMKKAAAEEHIIVLDDIYYPGINTAWKEMITQGVLRHLFDCSIMGQDIDFAIGHYKNVG